MRALVLFLFVVGAACGDGASDEALLDDRAGGKSDAPASNFYVVAP